MTYTREDDLVIALQQATKLYAGGRFEIIACSNGDAAAVERVLDAADQMVAWLRRVATITLQLVAIEEMDTGEIVSTPQPGDTMTTIDSSQQARYVINATDDRGFPLDTTFAVSVTDAVGGPTSVATAEILEAETGTASGKDELLVKAGTMPGSVLVKVYDPANPTTIFGSDSVDVVAGGVAAVTLGTPTVEEQEEPTP